MYSWVQAGLCGFMPLSYYSRSDQEAAQWTAPTSCALLGQRKSYYVLVYMLGFLNYFSLIIFIIFASLFECKALPGLDWQLWQMSQGHFHFVLRAAVEKCGGITSRNRGELNGCG